ncbi:MarR family transcriptional regulator [Aerococcaceae bacterium DSM 111020]|nr:MarR family transcriptional regulator [Aerococcaceae bacterium DSM 111020]
MKKKHYIQLLEGLDLAKEIQATLPELPKGIKPSYLYVLNVIVNSNGSLRIKDISEELGIASPNVTALVNEMEQQDLLKRQTLPEDKRVTYILATDSGQQLLEIYYTNFHLNVVESIDLKKKDIKKTIKTLSQLKDAFQESADIINAEQDTNES